MDVSVGAVVLGLGWFAGWFLLLRVPGVPQAVGLAPELTVVVPARDEERTLPTFLAGLANQTVNAAEVIVVDDGSTDATAVVAAAAGARVITGAPVPDGWLGKPWALRQGIDAARTDVVMLLDADVEPSSDLLARLGSCFAVHDGLVSVQPYHRVERWWEHLSAFFNIVAIMGAGIASLVPSRRLRMAFGPCMIARRTDLLEQLDDPSVHGSVLEDVALARAFADAGAPVSAFGGRDLVAFRMYGTPQDLVEGWTKNFAAGAGATPWWRLVLVVLWIAAVLAAAPIPSPLPVWFAFAAYVAIAVQVAIFTRQIGSFSLFVPLLPWLFAAVFVVVFVVSLVKTARGEVRWKGRTIRLRRG
jgi:4,4'-diaponeurosporenoate glycosyltransferase